MTEPHKASAPDFVGSIFSALGTSTGATGAADDNISASMQALATGNQADDGARAEDVAIMPDVDPAKIRAVFFDLDGTLLPMDLDEFLKNYFAAIGAYVAEKGLDVQAFSVGFSQGTKVMGHHGPEQTNCEAFWEEFFKHVDKDSADWEGVLDDFYGSVFPTVGAQVSANPASARAVNVLVEKGYPVVLATMPYFPLIAVLTRLNWADVDENAFARITHFENSCAAKPSTYYYAENLAACGLRGEDVLMVGNNTVEDLSFSELGAHVFLTTDWLLNPNGMNVADVPHGTMAEFAAWAETLPPCVSPAQGIATGRISQAEAARAYAENTAGAAEGADSLASNR